jgi:hypothetical protein
VTVAFQHLTADVSCEDFDRLLAHMRWLRFTLRETRVISTIPWTVGRAVGNRESVAIPDPLAIAPGTEELFHMVVPTATSYRFMPTDM